jgi:hypothetical protein
VKITGKDGEVFHIQRLKGQTWRCPAGCGTTFTRDDAIHRHLLYSCKGISTLDDVTEKRYVDGNDALSSPLDEVGTTTESPRSDYYSCSISLETPIGSEMDALDAQEWKTSEVNTLSIDSIDSIGFREAISDNSGNLSLILD